MLRLNSTLISRRADTFATPRYDRSRVTNGIVHLGVGNFHRAHQAVYTDDVIAAGGMNWGIIGASLRKPDSRDALMPQDCLYTLGVRSGSKVDWRVIGSIQKVLYAPDDPKVLIDVIAAPLTRIISLTVTEKAYCLHPTSGILNEDHPEISHDITNPHRPLSPLGYLYAGLKMRSRSGMPLPTLLSCDNLPANGKKLRAALIRFAELVDPDYRSLLEDHLHCPSTMVDRIVPETTDNDRRAARTVLGFEDAWPVMTEPFSQWVVEDDFVLGRPNWDCAGAEFVSDVLPYERMKLSLLNASHTALAFLGSYHGYGTVGEAMQDAAIRMFIDRFMRDDIAPVLKVPNDMNINSYVTSLLRRFENPALHHKLEQIASDSSQKIPQRFMGTIQSRLKLGLPLGGFAYALAAFILFLEGRDRNHKVLNFLDPQSESLKRRLREGGADDNLKTKALLASRDIFEDLEENQFAIRDISSALTRLRRHGLPDS